MGTITKEQAEAAQDKALEIFTPENGYPDVSVGITRDANGELALSVTFHDAEADDTDTPYEVDGVRVLTKVVGNVHAQGA